MRTVLTLLAILTITCTIKGQQAGDSSGHLKFKGIPIDGTLNQYIAKMKQAGFIHKATEDGVALLEGEFASYKKCFIGVSTLKQKDLVSKIAVIFPNRDDWGSLSGNYFNLKEMLTEKYGKPTDNVEKFQAYEPRDDGSRFRHAILGRCNYYSVFQTSNGSIQLSIEKNDVTSCFVKLAYFDKLNSDAVKKDAMEDL